MRICNEGNDEKLCGYCNIQMKENKQFEVILNLLKRNAQNDFGHMFPYYKI